MGAGNDENDRLTQVEQRLEQVIGRLAALERAAVCPPAPEPTPQGASLAPAPSAGAGTRPSAAAIADPAPAEEAAAIRDPVGEQAAYSWSGRRPNGMVAHMQARLSDIMNADPDSAARVFTALASPARITLLRALLHGPGNIQQLRRELDDPSAGQLYYHLRELMAAGLVVQQARSIYAIPRLSEVDICIQIAVAAHVTSVSNRYPPPGPGEPDEDEVPAQAGNGDQAGPDDKP